MPTDEKAYVSKGARDSGGEEPAFEAKECPSGKKKRSSSIRYARWFDRYVASNYPNVPDDRDSNGIFSKKEYLFDGTDCYQLRCTFLHEGSNAPHVERGKTIYSIVEFHIFRGRSGDQLGAMWESDDKKDVFYRVGLDLGKFIHAMADGVEKFLEQYPEANDLCPLEGPRVVYYSPLLDYREI